MLKFVNTWEHIRVETVLLGQSIGYIKKEHIFGYRFYPVQGQPLNLSMLKSIIKYIEEKNDIR